jgi:hypothetical protein
MFPWLLFMLVVGWLLGFCHGIMLQVYVDHYRNDD